MGPDCDDDNPFVATGDEVELCNGLSENCAGEVDPLPAEDMCPPEGANDPPFVTGWDCVPPGPRRGRLCHRRLCRAEYHDPDDDWTNGCECLANPISTVAASCDQPIDLGDVPDDGSTI